MKKVIAIILVMVICLSLAGCELSEADKVNVNISKQAEYFECERRITVYNARTDTIILTAEGRMDISKGKAEK